MAKSVFQVAADVAFAGLVEDPAAAGPLARTKPAMAWGARHFKVRSRKAEFGSEGMAKLGLSDRGFRSRLLMV
jgi:hypothetical protein